MAYRIFNYCLEIIRSAVQDKGINRITYRYPRIVPIVLYTGNQKWSSSNSFAKLQEGESKNETDNIEVKYKLVDVNEDETTRKEIIKIFDESECEEDMSTIAERIARELSEEKRAARVEGITIGINQGILQTIKQMIKMNLEDDFIKQVTGTKKSEIEKIRKEISNNK